MDKDERLCTVRSDRGVLAVPVHGTTRVINGSENGFRERYIAWNFRLRYYVHCISGYLVVDI